MTTVHPDDAAHRQPSTLDEQAITDLEPQLRGQLLRPGEAAYESARTVWNAMIDRRPALVIRCLNTADVTAGIRFARRHELPISIKGGGHNIAGLAVCDDGLMLDMSLMRGVWVDPGNKLAYAQAGCLLGDIDHETQIHGQAAVLGFVSPTGAAGLTLGGGFGYLTRRFGWTSDNLRSMDLVTADGDVVRASDGENSELFWALQGGGGNFGVVTNFTYELYDVGPEIVGGAIAWRADDTPAVLEMYRTLIQEAPPELTAVLGLRIAPPAPWLPADVHGQPIVAIFVCHTGPIDEAEEQLAVLKTVGSPVGTIIQRRSYVSQQGLLDATQPKGRRYYWKSEYLPALDPELLDSAAAHAGHLVSPYSAILLFPVDGAHNERSNGYSAAGNRDARIVLNITGSWDNPADDRKNIGWVREAWKDLRRFSTGGSYINFQTDDEGTDRVRAAYGENYERLAEVKSTWDPNNVFRMNKNIVPDGR